VTELASKKVIDAIYLIPFKQVVRLTVNYQDGTWYMYDIDQDGITTLVGGS